MEKNLDLSEGLLECWKTANQVSVYLIKIINSKLWNKKIPGYSHKTIGMPAVHLHNASLENFGNGLNAVKSLRDKGSKIRSSQRLND